MSTDTATSRAIGPTTVDIIEADFDLDVTVEPTGQRPDVMRIFASATEEPCQCGTDTCH